MAQYATAYVETDCTVEHEGRQFTAGGAYYDSTRLVAYWGPGETVTTWHGDIIGRLTVVSSWRVWSPMTDRHYAIRVTLVDGSHWYGRCCGEGMSLSCRRVKAEL